MHIYRRNKLEGSLKGIQGRDMWLITYLENSSVSFLIAYNTPGTQTWICQPVWATEYFCCPRHKLFYISDEKYMLRYWTSVLTTGTCSTLEEWRLMADCFSTEYPGLLVQSGQELNFYKGKTAFFFFLRQCSQFRAGMFSQERLFFSFFFK